MTVESQLRVQCQGCDAQGFWGQAGQTLQDPVDLEVALDVARTSVHPHQEAARLQKGECKAGPGSGRLGVKVRLELGSGKGRGQAGSAFTQ